MNVRLITTADQIPSIRSDWDLLAGDMPFRGWPWLGSWWESYGEGRRLLLVVVEDKGGKVVGLAPWFIDRTIGGCVLRFLGSGEVCTDYLSLLTSPEWEAGVADALAHWLLGPRDESDRNAPPHWDLLSLEGVDSSDTVMRRFSERLLAKGCRVDQQSGPRCWKIDLPETWDEYLGIQSKSHRKQIRRFERRFLDTGIAKLRSVTSDDDLDRGWEILVDLHQRRRQSLGQPGCFHSTRFGQFLRAAAERLLETGQLELHWVEWEGRPVAAEFHLTGAGTTYAYQAGVEPDALDLEPGRLINIATIKRAIEQGQKGFDFLRGDEPYKSHWRASPQPSVELRVVPPRVSSQVRHGIRTANEEVKDWIKSGLGAIGLWQPQEV